MSESSDKADFNLAVGETPPEERSAAFHAVLSILNEGEMRDQVREFVGRLDRAEAYGVMLTILDSLTDSEQMKLIAIYNPYRYGQLVKAARLARATPKPEKEDVKID